MGEQAGATVFVIDDDRDVRRSLERLIGSMDLDVETFSSAEEFLDRKPAIDGPACLVLDIRLPRLSGLDLQGRLSAAGLNIPIVFMTGHGTVPMTVRAMKAGAVDFLQKPFDDQALLDAVQRALQQNRDFRERESKNLEIHSRLDTLTPREREVLELVVRGLLNKQIAAELGTSEGTIKVHRSRVMQKMRADSLAELVRLAARAGIGP